MKILVTNDDGIHADGLWLLVKELKHIAPVVVVAPDRERSATGTAVTLHQTLRVQQVPSPEPGVEAYSVSGMPSDCVILALGKLVKGKVKLVASGVNPGKNLGDDALISGTVGAALQGYLHGCSALAISCDRTISPGHLDTAAKLAAMLSRKILSDSLPHHIFLSVNLPDLPIEQIKGIQVTRLAHKCHINTVAEGEDENGKYYRLDRQRITTSNDRRTDAWAAEQGYISITPLFAHLYSRPSSTILRNLSTELMKELQG
jgi:5'-nucleotidase